MRMCSVIFSEFKDHMKTHTEEKICSCDGVFQYLHRIWIFKIVFLVYTHILLRFSIFTKIWKAQTTEIQCPSEFTLLECDKKLK